VTFPIVDSHCHLDFDVLADDIDGVIARAGNAGVHLMVTISTRVDNFATLQAIAESHDNVFCTIGTHPHNAKDEKDITVEQLVEIAGHSKVIGIGETGLDFHYNKSPHDVQEQVFRTHIAAARETGLPLVIHSREAENDTLRIMDDEMSKGVFRPLLHCFSSKSFLATEALKMGLMSRFPVF